MLWRCPYGCVPWSRVVPPFHRGDERLRARAPLGDDLDGARERDVQRMDAFPVQDIDGSCERRGYGRNEDRELSVVELFDDEAGNEGVFDFYERRLPRAVPVFAGQLLGKAPKDRVAG